MNKLLQLSLAVALLFALPVGSLQAQAACAETETGQFVNPTTGGPCVNTVVSAVPFLRIAPDARGAAMGDVGLALSPDANAIHYNASRWAFAEEDLSMSATYTPWLQALGLNDVYLAYLAGYKKLDDIQAIGGSLRYFSLGDIQYTDENAQPLGIGKPNEFELAAAYARKLSDRFSGSLTLKYINSNLAAGQQVGSEILEVGQSFAGDIGFSYRNDRIRTKSGKTNAFAVGMAITNIGAKITYTQDTLRDFLPANFGLGLAYTFELDQYNTITLTGEANKLLVPSPCLGENCDDRERRNQSPIAAIVSSWGDAPGGFGEELREFTFSAGAEYWYDKQFAVRTGYFYENATKGNRQYLTAGLGLKYNIFGLNFSYLIPTSNQRNPLDNTLRFSIIFDFGAQLDATK